MWTFVAPSARNELIAGNGLDFNSAGEEVTFRTSAIAKGGVPDCT